jgi:putative membrane protein
LQHTDGAWTANSAEEVTMRSGLVFSSCTVIALALANPAFAQQAPATMPSNRTMPPQAQMPAQGQVPPGHIGTAVQAQKQKLREKDKSFAREAALSGMAEVELGKMAQRNAESANVREFGARMEQEHNAANEQLLTILAGKVFAVPQQFDEKRRRTLGRLSKMRGAEFDRAFVQEMVEDHDKAVKKFRQEAEHGKDADLKAFAQTTLPVLEQHQKLAHEISGSMTAVGSSGQKQGHKSH